PETQHSELHVRLARHEVHAVGGGVAPCGRCSWPREAEWLRSRRAGPPRDPRAGDHASIRGALTREVATVEGRVEGAAVERGRVRHRGRLPSAVIEVV